MRPLTPLLTVALVAALGLPAPAVAAPEPRQHRVGSPVRDGELTAVLSLAQRPGDRVRLRALASRRVASRAALTALAPAASHRTRVERFARAAGLRVVRADAWTVTVAAAAARVATVFGTGLDRSAEGTFATSAPAVPAELLGAVTSVVGIDDRRAMRPHATSDGVEHLQTGATLRAAYDVPQPWRGAGVSVGTLNLSGWNRSDLDAFAGHAVGEQVKEISVEGADPTALDGYGGEFEVALDSQTVLATAPEAAQRLYFSRNDTASIVAAMHVMADDAAAGLLQVASTSWGQCERDFAGVNTTAEREAYGVAIDRMLAEGATLYAASGDAGAYDCSYGSAPDNEAQVDFPASYVNTVAVGGTTLEPGGPEVAWRDAGSGGYLGDGSGGGESMDQPQPAYQVGLAPGTSNRLLPDVASNADPQTGLRVYVRSFGGWRAAGGTSLAAPTWAGLTAATLSSSVPARTRGFGNVLPLLYSVGSDPENQSFTDITSGDNGLYTARPGYDQVTGLGVPRWSALGPALLSLTSGAASPRTLTPAVRPGSSADPVLVASPYVNSLDVPIEVTAPASYQGFSAGETVPGCARQTPEPPATARLEAGAAQGPRSVVLAAFDSSRRCHLVRVTTTYDSVAPTATVQARLLTTADTRVRVTWGGADATSGVASWRVRLAPVGGTPVLDVVTSSRETVATLAAGRTYAVAVTPTDRAGNRGAVAKAQITLPVDDAAFSRTGAWSREKWTGDFRGSHLRSSARGATIRLSTTGRVAYLGLQRGPTAGLVDVFVDGRRTQRLDLYAPQRSRLRTRVAVWPTSGRHTVQLTVAGSRRAPSRGTDVVLDWATFTP